MKGCKDALEAIFFQHVKRKGEEEVQDSGSEFSVREESSDDEATLSADEGPVLEEDTDVPIVRQPAAEKLPIGRPDTWVAPNMEQP
ncbi:hypothetical protein NDU88_005503 [Pleurodeles waltl]|uniref:Uncharacterized protein n=1 Tax=Pleurodeles waltl TaxID=8319 RepID=A0AAV7WYG1_PLEWA|nr:hypothetical protein NDU88_005503 [Pleurodeles waltl]